MKLSNRIAQAFTFTANYPAMLLVPAPTDSYDHASSTRANLASMNALMAAFDASMNSLNDALDAEMQRLNMLESKLDKKHEDGKKNNDMKLHNSSKLTTITCPSTLEQALLDPCLSHHSHHRDGHRDDTSSYILSKAYTAQQEAHTAILSVLKQEAITMEMSAKPSDEWLDRASAFELQQACSSARDKNRVPPLFTSLHNSIPDGARGSSQSIMMQEVEYYKEARRNEICVNPTGTAHNIKQDYSKENDDNSVMDQSVMSGRRTVYSTMGNQSVSSHNTQGTAAHRRRQRKVHAAMRAKNRQGGGDGESMRELGESGTALNISASRQHLITGSLPFVCEMIHDTHGIGKMDGGGVFPPLESVGDLFYHGTKDLAYNIGKGESNGDRNKTVTSNGNVSFSSGRNKYGKGLTGMRGMNRISSSELYKLTEDSSF